MNQLSTIETFLKEKIAVIGVSRDTKKFGYKIYKTLKTRGYNVYPVNPNAEMILDDKCYSDINSLPEDVKNYLITTAPKDTEKVIKDIIAKGAQIVWVQQFSDTPEALAMLKNSNITTISKQCIYMFTKPVKGIHSVHRFFAKTFGKYPVN